MVPSARSAVVSVAAVGSAALAAGWARGNATIAESNSPSRSGPFLSKATSQHKWFQATHLLCASKKGMSSNQLHRILGVTLKTAWFMSHRIREAMREGKIPAVLGGAGKFVEADETLHWRQGKEPRVQTPAAQGGSDGAG
jgi:hypothetical protein